MPQRKYTEEEARERKNARQREYAKRTHFKSNNEYNKRTYKEIRVSVKKEIADMYKAKCDELGISYSKIIKEAINKFLEDNS